MRRQDETEHTDTRKTENSQVSMINDITKNDFGSLLIASTRPCDDASIRSFFWLVGIIPAHIRSLRVGYDKYLKGKVLLFFIDSWK
jgi:hypothetical protein